MFIKQFYTSCLSEAAYYIESEKEVVIIDPLRDIESYLKLAEERNAKIKYIFETHFKPVNIEQNRVLFSENPLLKIC